MRNLFLDIETAPEHDSIEKFTGAQREFLQKRYPDDDPWTKAGLHAETARIVCITVGYDTGIEIKTKSIFDDRITVPAIDNTESVILKRFAEEFGSGYRYVGHNLVEFDIPFIQRRMIIKGIKLPKGLKTLGKKPWELYGMMADTMKMWSSTAWNYRVPLKVLCEILKVPSPKDGMDGSQVGPAYYNGRIREIVEYCEKDVVAVGKCYRIIKELV